MRNTARTKRNIGAHAQRFRYVAKRLYLLFRLLRTRPLRQRLALLALILVPLVLLARSTMHTRLHKHQSATRKTVTEPEGNPEGGLALEDTDVGTNAGTIGADSTAHALRLSDPAPTDGARIAYFVQVGEDSVALVPRLLRAMHDERNVYIVHVDAKVKADARQRVSDYVSASHVLRANVHILRAEMVTYKGVSMVLNTLAAMALALRVDSNWHYFINLSGSDYPLLSARNQQLLLARPRIPLGRLNFLSLFPRSQWRPYAFRIRFMYWDPAVDGVQLSNARLRVYRGLREYPLERRRHFTFTKAEAWMILSRPFVRFITRSGYAKRMLLAHLHVRSAPEHYFSDVMYNHPLWRRTLVPDAFRKVVWVHEHRRSGQHPYILDRGRHPFSFWVYLKSTRSLFARKFSMTESPLLDRIDEQLSGFVDTAGKPAANASREARASRQAFYKNICTHFDIVTQGTLRRQNVKWPADAYPPPKAFDAQSI